MADRPASGRALAIGAVLFVAGLLTLWDPEAPPPDTPRITRSDSVDVAGTRLRIEVPPASVIATVGEAMTALPARSAPGGTSVLAGDGEAFVPVDIRQVTHSSWAGDDVEPVVSMRLGDERYDLGPLAEAQGGYFLRASAEPLAAKDVQLEVEFAEVVQRVDGVGTRETGIAAPLYGSRRAATVRRCHGGWSSSPATRRVMSCALVTQELPYLPGLGWAEHRKPGATWATVETSVRIAAAAPTALRRRTDHAVVCRMEPGGTGAVELDGERMSRELDEPYAGGSWGSTWFYDSAYAALVLPREHHEIKIILDIPCYIEERRYVLRLSRARSASFTG